MSKRVFGLFVLSALLLPAVSQAAIVNGDFESLPGLSGWTASNTNPPSSAIDITSDVNGVSGNTTSLVHLSASADFTWTANQYWDGEVAAPDLASDFFTLGQGETAVTFQYITATVGQGAEPAYISYYGQDDASGASGYNRLPLVSTGTGWNTYTLEFRDSDGNFLPAGSMVAIFADVLAEMPSYNGTDGQQVHLQSELYVDNFVLVPEPASLTVILLVAAALKRRSR